MTMPTLWFFGSFGEYSATVLEMLSIAHQAGTLKILGVVTTPPLPAGRDQRLKKTEVQIAAEKLELPLATPATLTSDTLQEAVATFGQPDLFLTAGYGKLLPESWLDAPKTAALNLHFSLLPKYRGANPAEWALLANEKETGVTLIEMSPEFDTGRVVAEAGIAILPHDTRETIYKRLYTLGGEVLPEMVVSYTAGNLAPKAQQESPTPYAKRFTRDDGFVNWQAITAGMRGEVASSSLVSPLIQTVLTFFDLKLDAIFIERASRALAGFPGLWTKVQTAKGEKRMKILSGVVENRQLQLQQVQIEGQSPATWNQVKNSLLEM